MIAFLVSLVVTLALVATALATGRGGRRRAHVRAVAAVLVSLVVTILLAEKLGRSYDLRAAGRITPVHLTVAKLATLAFLGPIATGVRLWRDPRARPWHRRSIALALGLTVVAVVTGTWMILAAPLR